MSPKFAQAVDPVFLHVLALLERISQDEEVSPQEERLAIRALLDQAQAIVGADREWELAKYALVSWIDEMLVETPWTGRDWWSNNVLEVELFNSRLCNEQFYLWGQEASSSARRDALEVYYVCVVLGFRGLYREPTLAAALTHAHGLPPDLEGWAKQAALAIRLGQGRPLLAAPGPDIAGAPPQRTRLALVWSAVAALGLIVANAIFAYYYLGRGA